MTSDRSTSSPSRVVGCVVSKTRESYADRPFSPGRWALGAALAVTSGTWQGAGAVFRSASGNGANSYAVGTVVLTDSRSGTALVNVTALQPGSTGNACLTVSYSGSLNSVVKVRAAITGSLGSYLNVTLDRGSGTCAAFGTVTNLYTGLASALASSYPTYASGLGSWVVTGGATTTLPFKLTYTVAADNGAQGTSSNLTLTWEAQS